MGQLMTQFIIMSVYIAIGIYLNRRKLLPENAGAVLSVLVVNVMTPCTIIGSFLNTKIDLSLKEIAATIVAALLMFVCLAVLGKISGKLFKIPKEKTGIWECMLVFSNNIFIGFPIIEAVIGAQALVYASLICIPCNALIFSYGLYLIGRNNENYQFSLRKIFNPCTAVSVLAIVLVLVEIKLPDVIVGIVKTLGGMSTPIILIVLGITIGESFRFEVLKEKKIYGFCLLRLMAAPLLTAIVLSFLGTAYEQMYKVLILTAAMPASNIAIILSETYKNDTEMATKYVTISTLVFILFIPFLNFL